VSERWVKEARPRRSHKLFKIRIEKEKAIPRQKIRKRDSDYYYHKRLVERAEREKLRESELVSASSSAQQGEAGPSTLASRAAKQEDHAHKSKLVGKAIVKGKEKETKVKEEVNPALATLFEDDEIVAVRSPETSKKKKKRKNKDKDGIMASGNMEPPAQAPSSTGKKKGKEKEKEKKRKRDSGLSTQTSGASTRRSSPEKKARTGTTSPKKQIPSTPKMVPPAPAGPSTRATSPGPSRRSAPSQTPPDTSRRESQEPLFLDSAPSPYDTFGEPMPGFFDSNPGSRVASVSQSQSDSQVRVKVEPSSLDFGGPSGADHDVIMEEETVNDALSIPEGSGSKSKSPSPHPIPISKTASPTLVADITGTSTSLVAVGLAAAYGPSRSPAATRAVTPVAPPTNNKTKSKSSTPAVEPATQVTPAPNTSSAPRVGTSVSAPVSRAATPAAPPTFTQTESKSPTPAAASAPPSTAQVQSAPNAISVQTAPTVPAANRPVSPVHEVLQKAPAKTIEGAATHDAPSQNAQQIQPATITSPAPSGSAINAQPIPSSSEGVAAATTKASEALATTAAASGETAPATRVSPNPTYSPPMEEPSATFFSPRKVSRSPSLPMDISSSPIIPAEQASIPDQAISPPRYVLNSPVKEAQPLPPSRPRPPSPISIKIPPSQRPKYVQPSRIQMLSDIVDPEAAARLAKKAAKNPPPPPPHAHPSLPDRPIPLSAPIHPSRLALHEPAVRAPISAPVQPRGFGIPPTGPSGYGPRQSAPLADQIDSFKSVKPPWDRRKKTSDPSDGQSPMW
jgi:hypothetical protein